MKEIPLIESYDNKKFLLASKSLRFANCIIDSFIFFFLLFLNAMILDAWLGLVDEGGSDWFLLHFSLIYVSYYTLSEYFFGKTIGKLITKTKVVKKGGNKPTFINILGRNSARLIPFDSLSFLFSHKGWHDLLSNTYVILDKK